LKAPRLPTGGSHGKTVPQLRCGLTAFNEKYRTKCTVFFWWKWSNNCINTTHNTKREIVRNDGKITTLFGRLANNLSRGRGRKSVQERPRFK